MFATGRSRVVEASLGRSGRFDWIIAIAIGVASALAGCGKRTVHQIAITPSNLLSYLGSVRVTTAEIRFVNDSEWHRIPEETAIDIVRGLQTGQFSSFDPGWRGGDPDSDCYFVRMSGPMSFSAILATGRDAERWELISMQIEDGILADRIQIMASKESGLKLSPQFARAIK